MDGFEDDFSPLQGSKAPTNISMDPPMCPTGNTSVSPSILDDNAEDGKDGDDVPALRCKSDYCTKDVYYILINFKCTS